MRKGLAEISPDTAWVIKPENRRYVSGFQAEDTQLTESSGSLLINKTRCILVTDSRYTTEAKAQAVDFEVMTLKEGLAEGLPAISKSLRTRVLGFEGDHITWGLHRELTEKLEALLRPVRLHSLDGLVEKMRLVKDRAEIRAMEASADLISSVLDEVIDSLKPGMTERGIAWQIEGLARETGAEGLAFPAIVASGPNAALPHAVPTDRRLKKGEPIIFDVGVKLDGYCSDMTRTAFLGKPKAEFKRIYAVVRQAQLAALAEVRPGVMSNHPDATARKIISEAGFGEYFGHGLGHGVGLATHEAPRLSPLRPSELRKGMVVTVEPGIYIPGKGGVRLEEMVIIESGGARILTKNKHFYDFAA